MSIITIIRASTYLYTIKYTIALTESKMHTIPVSDNSGHPSQQRQHKPLLLLLLLCRNYVHGASALYISIPLTHSQKKHSQLQSETTPRCSLYNRLVDTKRAFLSGPRDFCANSAAAFRCRYSFSVTAVTILLFTERNERHRRSGVPASWYI